jgi:serine/threonine protein kinase
MNGNLIGQTLLGRYRVDAFIGRGGMAEVYKVWDTKRAVPLAMKLLREDLAEDKIFLRRFKREARTLSNLQHPNIVRLYGLEQDGDLAFMLMDYVEGTTLRKEIFHAKKAISVERVLEVMRPVCSALHYAHQMGMVHCDAKPGNIMIEHTGRVLVTDFGISRMTDAATATMVGMGTPAYMAPEQARGQDPTPQTDIYALGVVLFEMLTGGERPFTGEQAETTGSTSEKVRWEQIHFEPPSPRKWNPGILPKVEALVLKCLEKDPTKRWRSALEMLNALEKTLLEKRESLLATKADTAPLGRKIIPEPSLEQGQAPEREPSIRQMERIPVHRLAPSDKQTRWMLPAGLVAALFICFALISVLLLGKDRKEDTHEAGNVAIMAAETVAVQPSRTIKASSPTATGFQPSSKSPTQTQSIASDIPCDWAAFVEDVSIPDSTELAPGEHFTKTWRLRNNGSCPWTSSYSMIFDQGDSMSGPASLQLTSGIVEPGQSIDVSVDLTAPNTPGTYKGFWKLRNGSGVVFGIGAAAKVAFWVEIVVSEPATKNFTLTFRNIHQCGTHPFYATIRIKNTGDFDFESARIIIKDLDAAVDLYGPLHGNAWFLSNENDCPPQESRVEPGEVSYISVNIGPAPISGNEAHVILRLCTEDDLGGDCFQKSTTFIIP